MAYPVYQRTNFSVEFISVHFTKFRSVALYTPSDI